MSLGGLVPSETQKIWPWQYEAADDIEGKTLRKIREKKIDCLNVMGKASPVSHTNFCKQRVGRQKEAGIKISANVLGNFNQNKCWICGIMRNCFRDKSFYILSLADEREICTHPPPTVRAGGFFCGECWVIDWRRLHGFLHIHRQRLKERKIRGQHVWFHLQDLRPSVDDLRRIKMARDADRAIYTNPVRVLMVKKNCIIQFGVLPDDESWSER